MKFLSAKNLRCRIDSIFATTGKSDILFHSMVVTQIAGVQIPGRSGKPLGKIRPETELNNNYDR